MFSLNGSAVSFDASGNMLTCNGKSYVWQGGHRLKSMTAGSTSLTFEYNADGLRWKKTGGSTTHLYFYRGTKLAADKTGSDTLLFRYDSQGNILGFTQVTASSTEHYTYVKSLQGDVLGILNGSGTEIASYTYDAWGRVLTVTGTDLALAERNPIRYRGYYYDSESQLYYLQSRYYDPELKRFISPDSYAQTYDSAVGANMFAYCLNNPMFYEDRCGECSCPSLDSYGCYLEHELAQEKYNSSTVNVYMDGESLPIEGMINICFYHPEGDSTRTNINVSDSLTIDNPFEQEAILKVVTESPYYSYEEFGSIEFMQAQWTAHNLAYTLATSGKVGNQIVSLFSASTDPSTSASVLDIRSNNNILKRAKFIYRFFEIMDNSAGGIM